MQIELTASLNHKLPQAIFKTGQQFIGFQLKFKFQVKSSDTPQLQMLRYVPALALVLFATTVHEHDLLLVSVFEVELKLSIFPYTRTVEVMKNIIRREQSTNSATFTNKVLLKYSFRLSVVQIYLWSSVLVSKTTLGGRP
jgi:hypothetical protein